MPEPIRLEGVRELITALHEIAPETEVAVRDELRKVGKPVAADATKRMADIHVTNVDFRVYIRRRDTVTVEEAKRKTTGTQPEFGALQMVEGLLPARDEKLEDAAKGIERRLDQILRRHGF